MPLSKDFSRIRKAFVEEYGKDKGMKFFYMWTNKKKLDDTKSFGYNLKHNVR